MSKPPNISDSARQRLILFFGVAQENNARMLYFKDGYPAVTVHDIDSLFRDWENMRIARDDSMMEGETDDGEH